MGNFKIFKKKCNAPIKEENENTNNQNADQKTDNSQNNTESVALLNQIAQLNKQIADTKKACDDKINQYNQQKVQIQQKLADLGVGVNEGELDNIKSVSIYESFDGTGKKGIIMDMLMDAMENSNLSYTFNETECKNFARYIMEQINAYGNWDKNENKWEDLIDIIKGYKKVQSKYGSSESDMNRLIESIRNVISVSDDDYSWLAGQIL